MGIIIKYKLGISILITGFLIAAGCVQAQHISYTGSLQYATGSYFFDENTASFSLANGISYSGDNVTVSFNVPFIIQNSPWVSYGAAGYIPTGGPDHKTVRDSSGRGPGNGKGDGPKNRFLQSKAQDATFKSTRKDGDNKVVFPDTSSYKQSSFGDPNLYASLKLFLSASATTSLRLNTGLKIPFADPSSGFGTGEWDYGLGMSLSQRFRNYFLIADLMKWWFGDLPELELQDPFTYGFGFGRSFDSGSWLVNATYSGYSEIIDGYEPPRTLNFGIGHFLSQNVSLNSTISFGLSESSSDFSLGFGWMIRF